MSPSLSIRLLLTVCGIASAGAASATGMMAQTLDLAGAVQNGVAERLSMAGPLFDGTNRLFTGGDPWIEAGWTHNRAKRYSFGLPSGYAGYKSDLGTVAAGYDHTLGNFRVGLALLGASGTIKQTGSLSAIKSDSDFFAVDLYGTWTGKKVNVIANAGYITGRNDMKIRGRGFGDMDTEAWFGSLKFETTFNVGPVNFVPYYGVRFTHVSSDDWAGFSFSDVNMWQFPVGFNAGIDYTCEAGWRTRFDLDAAIVPSAGKRKTYASAPGDKLSMRIGDSEQYRVKVGLLASKGQHAFGANYGAAFAAHGRFDQNVKISYQFMY